MTDRFYAFLEDRGILAVAGEDARTFLQGLVSNDVDRVSPTRAVHAALLTPQGKYLHDFFISAAGDALLLDCEAPRLADLKRRLGIYKLRAKVDLAERTGDFAVAALWGNGWREALGLADEAGNATALAGGGAFVDPRLAAAGGRAVLPRADARATLEDAGFTAAPVDDHDALRLRLGLPDGARDMVLEKALLLENGFDELGSIAWDKGCYMGQELTARTKYRGVIRKRLVPVRITGPLPPSGTPVMLDGTEAGEMRSGRDGVALALLRVEHMEKAAGRDDAFTAGEAHLTPVKPDWAEF